MKIIINTEEKSLEVEEKGQIEKINLYSDEAFKIISKQWLKTGWNQKHNYTFSWLGRPVIQLPEDMIRVQETIFNIKPDVILETGVAHGGSLVYYASICKTLGKGKVVGVDIEIRPHNRKAIEEHFLSEYITLIEGNAVAEDTIKKVRQIINPTDRVLVLLDSCHTYSHVKKELDMYSKLVSVGSYIVVTDGIMQILNDVPRGQADWDWNNPVKATKEFLEENKNFIFEMPKYGFNESTITDTENTHWPMAWLKRIK